MENDEMLISDDFGKLLKKLRKSRGYSLEALASRANLSASYLHRLEAGTRKSPGLPKIIKLAEALSVPLGSLIGASIDSHEGESMSISELFFNHTVEQNDVVLDAQTKALLVEIAETALLLKWENATI